MLATKAGAQPDFHYQYSHEGVCPGQAGLAELAVFLCAKFLLEESI